MPWRRDSMKGVVNCDKPRVGETALDPGIPEWGNPGEIMLSHPELNP